MSAQSRPKVRSKSAQSWPNFTPKSQNPTYRLSRANQRHSMIFSQILFFHWNPLCSLKSSIFFNDFSYKFTAFVRKTPGTTTWFRIEKSWKILDLPQNRRFWRWKQDDLIDLHWCTFLAKLGLCGPGGFPYKCFYEVIWITLTAFFHMVRARLYRRRSIQPSRERFFKGL